MERDVGIVGYLTSTPGVGGTLKDAPEDFVVEEISSPPPPSAEGRFTVATIRVRNWETNRLVRELARALHVSRRRIGFAGTKDKHAVTTRLFSFEGIPIDAVRELQSECLRRRTTGSSRSEEHTSELQSLTNLVCRLLLEKKKFFIHH